MYDYDLFVIGGGSGGIRSARWSSILGAKVALCEKDRLGGTCVIRGCIPKKLMLYASSFKKDFEVAQSYGWELKESPKLNWSQFYSARDREIRRLENIYRQILKKHNVDYIPGSGVLKGPHTVEVQGKTYTARYILIAVGGRPHKLPVKGAELCITSDELFLLKKLPQSLLVLGAGYIGLEFAGIFKGLGSDTAVMFRKQLVLSGFDKDIRKNLQKEMAQKNIKMLAHRTPILIEKKGQSLYVTDSKGDIWSGDQVLMATGRKANTEGLALADLGISTDSSQIIVNKKFQTSCPNVLAIGDCAHRPYDLTPVALNEGIFVSEKLFSDKANKKNDGFNYENIPSAIFTQPEVGTVGLSEEQALQKGFQIKVYESHFRPLKLTLTPFQEKTYMKLIVCLKTDRVLGCHILGDSAGEILQGFAVAVQNQLKKSDWDKTIGIHPTSAEEFVTMREARP